MGSCCRADFFLAIGIGAGGDAACGWTCIVENGRKLYDANDFLYGLEASWDYDPEPDLAKITAMVLTLNFADDMINDVEFGRIEGQYEKSPMRAPLSCPQVSSPMATRLKDIRSSGRVT